MDVKWHVRQDCASGKAVELSSLLIEFSRVKRRIGLANNIRHSRDGIKTLEFSGCARELPGERRHPSLGRHGRNTPSEDPCIGQTCSGRVLQNGMTEANDVTEACRKDADERLNSARSG